MKIASAKLESCDAPHGVTDASGPVLQAIKDDFLIGLENSGFDRVSSLRPTRIHIVQKFLEKEVGSENRRARYHPSLTKNTRTNKLTRGGENRDPSIFWPTSFFSKIAEQWQ